MSEMRELDKAQPPWGVTCVSLSLLPSRSGTMLPSPSAVGFIYRWTGGMLNVYNVNSGRCAPHCMSYSMITADMQCRPQFSLKLRLIKNYIIFFTNVFDNYNSRHLYTFR